MISLIYNSKKNYLKKVHLINTSSNNADYILHKCMEELIGEIKKFPSIKFIPAVSYISIYFYIIYYIYYVVTL